MRLLRNGLSASDNLSRRRCRLPAILLISLVLALGLAGTAHAADAERLYVVSFNESLYPPGSVVINDTGNLTESPYLFTIDPISGKVMSATSLKEPANFLVVSPSGRQLFLAGVRSGNITVIDALNLTVNRTFSLNSSVSGIALSPSGSQLYAAMPEVQSIYSLDVTSGIIRTIIQLSNTPRDLALSADGKRIYAMDGPNGSIAIVDAQGNLQLATLNAGSKLVDIAVSSDGMDLYAANNDSMISVYDTTAYLLKEVIANVTRPSSLTTDFRQSWIYVASSSGGSLTRIDTVSENVSVVVSLGSHGLGKPVVSTDGLKVFVPEREGKSVAILGATTLSRQSSLNFTDPAMVLAAGIAPESSVVIPVPTPMPTPTPRPTIYSPGTWGTPTPFQIPLPIPPKISIAPASENNGYFGYKTWLPPFRPLTTGDVVIIVFVYFIVLVILAGITYVMMFRRGDEDEDEGDDSDDDDR